MTEGGRSSRRFVLLLVAVLLATLVPVLPARAVDETPGELPTPCVPGGPQPCFGRPTDYGELTLSKNVVREGDLVIATWSAAQGGTTPIWPPAVTPGHDVNPRSLVQMGDCPDGALTCTYLVAFSDTCVTPFDAPIWGPFTIQVAKDDGPTVFVDAPIWFEPEDFNVALRVEDPDGVAIETTIDTVLERPASTVTTYEGDSVMGVRRRAGLQSSGAQITTSLPTHSQTPYLDLRAHNPTLAPYFDADLFPAGVEVQVPPIWHRSFNPFPHVYPGIWDFEPGQPGSNFGCFRRGTWTLTVSAPGYRATEPITFTLPDPSMVAGHAEITARLRHPLEPRADFTWLPVAPAGTIRFVDASRPGNGGAGGPIVRWEWDFGDGQTGEGTPVEHAYHPPGDYVVGLTVTDGDGLQNTIHRTVTAPTATCTATRTGPPGRYHFVASASDLPGGGGDPGGGAGAAAASPGDPSGGADVILTALMATTGFSYDWDFGDGSPHATGENTTYDYTTPGDYDARVTITDTSGNWQVATCPVHVPAPELGLAISLPGRADGRVTLDEVFTVRLTVSADPGSNGVGDLTDLAFAGDPLRLSPPGHLELVSGPVPAIPADFTLAPGAEPRSFDFEVKAIAAGRATLTTRIAGKDGAGRAVDTADVERNVNAPALKVTVTADPATIDLEEGDGKPIPQDTTVTVKVENVVDEPVDGVTLPADLDMTWKAQSVQPAPFPFEETSGPSTGTDLGTLAPGESRTATYSIKVNDDGKVELAALVTAHQGDTTITARGAATVTATEEVLLAFAARLDDDVAGGGLIKSGTRFLVLGEITNRSLTNTIELDRLVATMEGNGGCGAARPVDIAWGSPCGPVVGGKLAPGKTMFWAAPIQTVEGGGTRVTIGWTPGGKLIEDDGSTRAIEPEEILIEPDSGPFEVSIDDSAYVPPPFSLKDFWGRFTVATATSAGQWLVSTFNGIGFLLSLPVTAIMEPRSTAGAAWNSVVQTAEAVDIYIGTFTEADLEDFYSRIAADLVLAGYGAADEMTEAVRAAFGPWAEGLGNAYGTGDWDAVADHMGQATGNVIMELAFSFLADDMGKMTGARAERFADVANAGPPIKTIPDELRTLKAGQVIDEGVLARGYGVGKHTIEALKTFAREKNLLISFRFRNPISLKWIDDFAAVLKHEAIKLKNVDDVDVAFLGYRPDDLGSVILKKPMTLDELRASGAYQAAPPRVRQLAEDRLARRAKEWDLDVPPGERSHGLASDMFAANDAERIEVPWNYQDNFAQPLENGIDTVGRQRAFKLQKVDDLDDYYEVKMGNRDGDLRRITGDIDLVDIRRADGRALTVEERLDIYRQLQDEAILDLQHPETASWVAHGDQAHLTKVNALSDHLPGGEPLGTLAPSGFVRATFINPALSLFDNATGQTRLWLNGAERTVKESVFHFGALGFALPRTGPGRLTGRWLPTFVWTLDPAHGGNGNGGEGDLGNCSVQTSTGPNARVTSPDRQGGLQSFAPGQGWSALDTSGCAPAGGSGLRANAALATGPVIEVLPQVGLAEDASAGETVLEINDPYEFAPDLAGTKGDWLEAGQWIVIAPGTAIEEYAKIAGFGSLILDRPLQFDHQAGEFVSVVHGPPGATDTTPPVITFGGLRTYGLLETVEVTCAFEDSESGIDASACTVPDPAPAWTFGPGSESVSAYAIDNAGNPNLATGEFTVTATFDDLCTLTGQFSSKKNEKDLCNHLEHARKEQAKGKTKQAAKQIDEYVKKVEKDRKAFTAAERAVLIAFARSLP